MEIKEMFAIILSIVLVALILVGLGVTMGSDYNTMGQAVAGICVPIGLFAVILVELMDSKVPTGVCIVAGGSLGIIFAFILKSLYDSKILVDSMVDASSGVTITDLMAVTVILWLLVGVVFEVSRK